MNAVDAARQVEGLLGDGAAVVLAEGGLGGWVAAVAVLSDDALARAAGSRLPGLALLQALREHHGRGGAVRPAAAITRGLVHLLADRLGPDHPDTLAELGALGALALRAGRPDEAARLLGEAWEGLSAFGDDPRLAAVGARLGPLLAERGELEGAERVLAVAWRIRARGDAARAAPLATVLGEVRRRRGDLAGALPVLQAAWSSAPGPATGLAIGRLLLDARRPKEALAPLRHAAQGPSGAEGLALLARAAEACGEREEAWRAVVASLDATRSDDAEHAALPGRLALAASMAAARGRGDEAERLLHEALEVSRRREGDGSASVARRRASLGRLVLGLGRPDEAVGWLEAAFAGLRREPDHAEVAGVLVEALRAAAAQAARFDRALAEALAARADEVAKG